jgi:uncharacterized caspase-like protein
MPGRLGLIAALLLWPIFPAGAQDKKAVLIGINCYNPGSADCSKLNDVPAAATAKRAPAIGNWRPDPPLSNLDNALNDVALMKDILEGHQFSSTVLQNEQATADAILSTLSRYLVDDARKGDLRVVYYSGRGSYVRNHATGGVDQTLIPSDRWRGTPDVGENELLRIFWRAEQKGVRVVFISETSHVRPQITGPASPDPPMVNDKPPSDIQGKSIDASQLARVFLLTAAQPDQVAERTTVGNPPRTQTYGAFTWALKQAVDANQNAPLDVVFQKATAFLRIDHPLQAPSIQGRNLASINIFGEPPRTGQEVSSVGKPPAADASVLKMYVPPTAPASTLLQMTAEFAKLKSDPGIEWIDDETGDRRPTHLLSWDGAKWNLNKSPADGHPIDLGTIPTAARVKTVLPLRARLFVVFPPSPALSQSLSFSSAGPAQVLSVGTPGEAQYWLRGRLSNNVIAYSWVRRDLAADLRASAERSPLPPRTAWVTTNLAATLSRFAYNIAWVRQWLVLEAPSRSPRNFPYHLSLRDTASGRPLDPSEFTGGRRCKIYLQADEQQLRTMNYTVSPRYVYIFTFDQSAKGTLLFPILGGGNEGNHLPGPGTRAGPLIPVSKQEYDFEVAEPYGQDTYLLLTTEKPLPDPSILEWEPGRPTTLRGANPLPALLSGTGWSCERFQVQSAPPNYLQADLATFIKEPRAAVVVGVSAYPEAGGFPKLKYAADDARSVAQILKNDDGYDVRLLVDDQVTRSSLLSGLRKAAAGMAGKGTLLLYFSGAAALDSEGKQYLALHDSDAQDLKETGLEMDKVVEVLRELGAMHKVIMVDARSSLPGPSDHPQPPSGKLTGNALAAQVEKTNGLFLFSGASRGEQSYEADELGHGVFSYFVMDGLKAAAATRNRPITFLSLADSVSRSVRDYSTRMGWKQNPYEAGNSKSDFIVAGSAGPASIITLETRGTIPSRPAGPAAASAGIRHALVIGIDKYDFLPGLKTPVSDAESIKNELENDFDFGNVQLLANPGRAQILLALNNYRRTLTPDDSLLIYYAGHGYADREQLGKAYWLPADGQNNDTTNWIAADEITSNLKAMKAHHVLIISDSCFSGALTRDANVRVSTDAEKEREKYLTNIDRRTSRLLLASGGNEPVLDGGGDGRHSIFATVLMQSLKDAAGDKFTVDELFSGYIRERVAGRSAQVPECAPLRDSGHDGGTFIFQRKSSSK